MIYKRWTLMAGIGFWLISFMVQAQEHLQQGLQAINENVLRAHTRFLSDDLLGGRAPGSRGSLLAQRYIASQMQLLGLLQESVIPHIIRISRL